MSDEGAPHKRLGDAMDHIHQRLNNHDEAIMRLVAGQQVLSETMERLVLNVGRVAEVLEAFNNAKGFWLTLKFISGFAKIMLPILVFAGLAWAAFAMYLKGK